MPVRIIISEESYKSPALNQEVCVHFNPGDSSITFQLGENEAVVIPYQSLTYVLGRYTSGHGPEAAVQILQEKPKNNLSLEEMLAIVVLEVAGHTKRGISPKSEISSGEAQILDLVATFSFG